MSCHVMSCHVMSCHVMSCHIILYYIILYYIILYYIILYHIIHYIYHPRNGLHHNAVHHKTQNTHNCLRAAKYRTNLCIMWTRRWQFKLRRPPQQYGCHWAGRYPQKSLFIACFQQDSPAGTPNLKTWWPIPPAQGEADLVPISDFCIW